MRIHRTIVIAAAKRAQANAMLERHGYGKDNLSVALIPTTRSPQDPPATHYGLSWAMSEVEKQIVQRVLVAAGIIYKMRVVGNSFAETIALDGYKRFNVERASFS